MGKENEIPTDDVLVRRIISLQNELEAEKAAHKKEVEQLNDRLNALIRDWNRCNCEQNADIEKKESIINDETFDVLFTMINLYPFTSDGDLAHEFGISRTQVKMIAKTLKLSKSKEARREAKDYLERQHRELIERRGGDQGNHFVKPVEQVAKNGRVLNTFISASDAEEITGCNSSTIRKHCQQYYSKKKKYYTKEGFTFRYKEQ